MYPMLVFLERPERSSRLLLLLRPVLVIPHLFWSVLFGILSSFIQFLSFWAIMFTGRHPVGLWRLLERYFRYGTLLQAWSMFLTDRYPPFMGDADRDYPVAVRTEHPGRMSRATVFFRLLILIPHYFYFIGISVVYSVVQFLAWWTILLLGRMADWQFSQSSAYFIYTARLNAYLLFLVDEYPPFNGVQPRAAEERFA